MASHHWAVSRPSRKLRKLILPTCVIIPGESWHPGFFMLAMLESISQDWAWAPDHHEVTVTEWELPCLVDVRASCRNCETSLMVVTRKDPSWVVSTCLGSPRWQYSCISCVLRLSLLLTLCSLCLEHALPIPPRGPFSHRYRPQHRGGDNAGFPSS